MTSSQLKLEKLQSKDPKIKFGYAKELLKMGEKSPELLYDSFDTWKEMLQNKNKILRWTAIDLIGYISKVDGGKKSSQAIDELVELLHSGELILCSHAIFSLGLIGKYGPETRPRILSELIAIQNDQFKTDMCKTIATGKVLETLGLYLSEMEPTEELMDFIKKAVNSSNKSCAKKARQLLKEIPLS